MTFKLSCDDCGKEFTPAPKQVKFIKSAISKDMTLVMLECPNCPGSHLPRNGRNSPTFHVCPASGSVKSRLGAVMTLYAE